jgi:hypothetical protein
MRDGPGKTAIKQKALKVLQQRKMYESQRDQLQSQSWNMEQAGMMQDNLKNTMTTIDAMKTTTKELRKQYGKVNIDKIEKLQDEMADLMDMGNDIQDAISRSYDVPEDVDESMRWNSMALASHPAYPTSCWMMLRRHNSLMSLQRQTRSRRLQDEEMCCSYHI